MTLNQVLSRIRTIALSHQQVRNFKKGLVTDFLSDHTTKYPSVFLQSNGGYISTVRHETRLSYRMFVLDLVHVSEDHGQNEDDVLSDMLSIAMDLVAQINDSNWGDWFLTQTDNSLQELVEYDNDMIAGYVLDFSLRIIFNEDKCKIPTDLIITPNPDDMDKLVYDVKYIATGTEGLTLVVPEIIGKKVLFITRESNPIYKTSSAPESDEYVWNNANLLLGTVANYLEKFLILYRNY